MVHGSEDLLIQPELGRRLFDAASEPKQFVLVEGGSNHNTNAIGQTQYRAALPQVFNDGCVDSYGHVTEAGGPKYRRSASSALGGTHSRGTVFNLAPLSARGKDRPMPSPYLAASAANKLGDK